MISFLPKIFLIYACLACGNSLGDDAERIKYIDIVTFLEDLYPDLEAVKDEILETNSSIPSDIRDEAPSYQLLVQNELNDLESTTVLTHQAGLMDSYARECILNSYHEAIATQMFNDIDLKTLCKGEKYHEILTSAYLELENIEEHAKNMPSQFLKANLWCSTNYDTQQCYEQSRHQVLSRSSEIVAITERAQKIESQVEEDFNNAVKPCLDKAVQNLDNFDRYVKNTIADCLMGPQIMDFDNF